MITDFGKKTPNPSMAKLKILLIWIALIISVLFVLTYGIRPISPRCIAVDNEQHLYLSDRRNLFVVLQGKILLLKRFQEPVGDISVTEDDYLGVEAGDQIYWFDLNSSHLAQRALCPTSTPASAADEPIGAHSETVLPDEQNGITYSLSYQDSPLRYRIYRTSGTMSEVFFFMPLLDVLLDCLTIALYGALLICVIIFFTRKSRIYTR